jgi:DNA-binding NtrC family response regulator
MAYAAALVDGACIEPWHLPEAMLAAAAPAAALADPEAPPVDDDAGYVRPADSFRPIAEELQALERRRMTEALRATGGVQRRAAELIGMPVRTFTFKLTQYGLRDGAPRPAPVPGAGRIARRRSRGTAAPVSAGGSDSGSGDGRN